MTEVQQQQTAPTITRHYQKTHQQAFKNLQSIYDKRHEEFLQSCQNVSSPMLNELISLNHKNMINDDVLNEYNAGNYLVTSQIIQKHLEEKYPSEIDRVREHQECYKRCNNERKYYWTALPKLGNYSSMTPNESSRYMNYFSNQDLEKIKNNQIKIKQQQKEKILTDKKDSMSMQMYQDQRKNLIDMIKRKDKNLEQNIARIKRQFQSENDQQTQHDKNLMQKENIKLRGELMSRDALGNTFVQILALNNTQKLNYCDKIKNSISSKSRFNMIKYPIDTKKIKSKVITRQKK